MTNEITTIKILKKDRDWLEKLYGQPMHAAFHKVRDLCPHPEETKTYLSAEIPNGVEAINKNEITLTVYGFRCGVCNRYVFPDPRVEDEHDS